MRVLVLGGTRHVGGAVVESAGVDVRRGDRLDPASLAAALGDDEHDLVVDTWSSAPVAVRDRPPLPSAVTEPHSCRPECG